MRRIWFPASAVFLSVWGLYVAFWNITSRPIVSDESIYTSAGFAYVNGEFELNREHPPTAKYIIGLFQLAFGPGLESARLAAATIGVLTGLVI
jgi:4-amino-4-deoxy-L-arabinose transferase-like glycosyltransferase